MKFNDIDVLRDMILAEFVSVVIPIDSMIGSDETFISPKIMGITITDDTILFDLADYDVSVYSDDTITQVEGFKKLLQKSDQTTFHKATKLFFKVCLYRGDYDTVPSITIDDLELEEITCTGNTLNLVTSVCRLL